MSISFCCALCERFLGFSGTFNNNLLCSVNLRFLHENVLVLSWLGNLFQTMISETNVSSFPFEISRMELTILNITLILQSDDFETWVNFKIALDIHVRNEDTQISHYSTIVKSLMFSAALDTLDLFC